MPCAILCWEFLFPSVSYLPYAALWEVSCSCTVAVCLVLFYVGSFSYMPHALFRIYVWGVSVMLVYVGEFHLHSPHFGPDITVMVDWTLKSNYL